MLGPKKTKQKCNQSAQKIKRQAKCREKKIYEH